MLWIRNYLLTNNSKLSGEIVWGHILWLSRVVSMSRIRPAEYYNYSINVILSWPYPGHGHHLIATKCDPKK